PSSSASSSLASRSSASRSSTIPSPPGNRRATGWTISSSAVSWTASSLTSSRNASLRSVPSECRTSSNRSLMRPCCARSRSMTSSVVSASAGVVRMGSSLFVRTLGDAPCTTQGRGCQSGGLGGRSGARRDGPVRQRDLKILVFGGGGCAGRAVAGRRTERRVVRREKGVCAVAFNPFDHRGIPLDEQLRNWDQLDMAPVDPDESDPYTKCRIIALNGIEMEATMFSHHFARVCPDLDVRQQLARVRYMEQQQQKVVNWLLPGQASVLETTLSYEQVATDLTAWVARMEPDPYLTAGYQFGLLEDFDHLYRYANLYEMIEHRKAEKVVDQLTEVMPGRPTIQQHRDPMDNVRQPYD